MALDLDKRLPFMVKTCEIRSKEGNYNSRGLQSRTGRTGGTANVGMVLMLCANFGSKSAEDFGFSFFLNKCRQVRNGIKRNGYKNLNENDQ